MFLALALVCFALGFTAAALVVARPGKRGRDVIRVLDRIPAAIRALHPLSDKLSEERLPTIRDDEKDDHLLTKHQVESQYDMSTWQRLAYEDLKMTVLARGANLKTFPCVFATMGYNSNEHRYLFLESDDPSEPRNIRLIGPALASYLAMAPSIGSNTSLVIMGAPSESNKSVTQYNGSFWNMLRGLRILDPKSWPEDVPLKTEAEKWTFCFSGQPVFPVMFTPAHTRRWSRHMSVPVIALQPKWVLDRLLNTPEKREAATGKVRKLLKEYDQIEISPDLTSYGAPGTSESRQLCLLDENETATCPYQDLDQ